MNGYLMQKQKFVWGEDLFIESFSPENRYGTVFEDDGETAYFYAVEQDEEGKGQRILDALHIYETTKTKKKRNVSELMIVWSKDWLKCALIIDSACHAIFDFEKQGGYNINEFPLPNSFWTKHGRKLTNEIIQNLF
ncbi:MAG: DUF2251 domain-containing protein [Bacteroidetes bacterium]|nr:DUF2251 domain-containing protein [Bacteroidota bacterium]